MATYIPGVESYMPAFAPFTPDYAFLSNVLDVKTNRYNTNYEQLSDLYSNVVYGDLSRTDTQEIRDQYTQNLGPRLQQISGMDLSVMHNAEAAKGIFKPYYENDLIVKDLGYTKTYKDQMRSAEMLRNSNNDEQREQYWQEGIEKMNYDMQDFINASSEEALQKPMPKYVPDADLYQMSMDYFKEQEYDVKKDELKGGWIITRKNGDLITEQAMYDARQALSDDPRVRDWAATKSYVQGRRFAEQGVQSGQFESIDAAETAWANSQIQQLENYYNAKTAQERYDIERTGKMLVSWDNYNNIASYAPGSEKAIAHQSSKDRYAAAVKRLRNDEELASNKGQDLNPNDNQSLKNRAYNLMMNYTIDNEIKGAAVTYANTHSEVSFKSNPYKLADYKHSLRMSEKLYSEQLKRETKRMEGKIGVPGQDDELLDAFGNSKTQGAAGTTQVDGDSWTTNDYVEAINGKEVAYIDEVRAEQADAIVDFMENFAPSDDNMYEISDGRGGYITGTPKQIKETLMKPENADLLDGAFDYIWGNINVANPESGVTISGDGADFILSEGYPEAKARYKKVADKRQKLDMLDAEFKNTMLNNLNTMLENANATNPITWPGTADLDPKYNDHLKALSNTSFESFNGAPPLIIDPNKGLLSEDEYVAKWLEESKGNHEYYGYKDGDHYHVTPGWEHTYNDYWDGQNHKSSLETDVPTFGHPRYAPTGTDLPGYDQGLARNYAKSMYALQKDLLNYSLSGKTNNPDNWLFKSFNPDQYMRDVPPEEMNVGDLTTQQLTGATFNPFNPNANDKAKNYAIDMINQVNNLPIQDVEFSMGGLLDMEFFERNPDAAKALFDQWKIDVTRVLSDPKSSKTNPPIAEISYINAYDPTGGVETTKAGYQIKFNPKWLQTYEEGTSGPAKDTELLDKKIAASSDYTINLTFDKNLDQGRYREGVYNSSSIISFIENSDNKQYLETVQNGGAVKVHQDRNGDYIINTMALNVANVNGKPDYKQIPQPPMNASQQLYQDGLPKEALDQLVNVQTAKLEQIALVNLIMIKQMHAKESTVTQNP